MASREAIGSRRCGVLEQPLRRRRGNRKLAVARTARETRLHSDCPPALFGLAALPRAARPIFFLSSSRLQTAFTVSGSSSPVSTSSLPTPLCVVLLHPSS